MTSPILLAIIFTPLFTNSTFAADGNAATRPAATQPRSHAATQPTSTESAAADRQAAEADVEIFLNDDLPTEQRLAAAERVRKFLYANGFSLSVVPEERAAALLTDPDADRRLRAHALAYVRLTDEAQGHAADLLATAEGPGHRRAVYGALYEAHARNGGNFSSINILSDKLAGEVRKVARNSDNPETWANAITLIIYFNGSAHVESLVREALESPDTDVRVLIFSLKVVNGYRNKSHRDKFLPLVEGLVDHPDPEVARLASVIAAQDRSSSEPASDH